MACTSHDHDGPFEKGLFGKRCESCRTVVTDQFYRYHFMQALRRRQDPFCPICGIGMEPLEDGLTYYCRACKIRQKITHPQVDELLCLLRSNRYLRRKFYDVVDGGKTMACFYCDGNFSAAGPLEARCDGCGLTIRRDEEGRFFASGP